MTSLRIASWVLLAVGTLSALGILAASLNLAPANSTLTLWILTASGFLAGLLLPALADSAERSAFPLSATGGVALLMSLASLIAILANALGMMALQTPANLWLLAIGGLLIGPFALAAAQSLKRTRTA